MTKSELINTIHQLNQFMEPEDKVIISDNPSIIGLKISIEILKTRIQKRRDQEIQRTNELLIHLLIKNL